VGYWTGRACSEENLGQLGPFVDGICGTTGKYSVLNDCISAGWTRILLTQGASLNANLTITARTSIIGLQASIALAGNYAINVQAADCYFEGFSVSNNAGIGFYVTGARARFFRMGALNCLSHGFHFNASWGDHEMLCCLAYANGGDGVRLEVNNYAALIRLLSQSNVGYGVRDNANAAQIGGGSLIYGNTAGQISGGSTYIDHSVRTT
jgi:hypothetical protein